MRGEVWWAELDQPAGRRPVLLISRNEAYIVRSIVKVAPVTTRIRNIPTEVPLGTADGMSRNCVVNLDTITTIPKDCLSSRITSLIPQRIKEVEAAIHFAMGMEI